MQGHDCGPVRQNVAIIRRVGHTKGTDVVDCPDLQCGPPSRESAPTIFQRQIVSLPLREVWLRFLTPREVYCQPVLTSTSPCGRQKAAISSGSPMLKRSLTDSEEPHAKLRGVVRNPLCSIPCSTL